MKNAQEWVESLRVVNCLSKSEFLEIYDIESGNYLWQKFKIEFEGDVFKFLSYLDSYNAAALFNHVLNKMN